MVCENCGEEINDETGTCQRCSTEENTKKEYEENKPEFKEDSENKQKLITKLKMYINRNLGFNLLIISLLFVYTVPYFFKSLIMTSQNQPISHSIVLILDIAGIIIGSILFVLSLNFFYNENIKKISITNLIIALKNMSWIIALIVLFEIGINQFSEKFILSLNQNYILYYIIVSMSFFLFTNVILVLFFESTTANSENIKLKNIFKCFLILFTKPIRYIKCLLLMVLILLLPEIINILIDKTSFIYRLSFTTNVALQLLIVSINAFLLKIIIDTFIKITKKYIEKNGNKEGVKNKQRIISLISLAFSFVILISAGIFIKIDSKSQNTVVSVQKNIEEKIIKGQMFLAVGDIPLALNYFDEANTQISMWKYMASDEKVKDLMNLEELKNQNPSNKQLIYFQLLNSKDYNAFENYAINQGADIDWYLSLLDVYNKIEKESTLTKEQKNRRKELLQLCISNGDFVNEILTEENIKKESSKLIPVLKKYEDFLEAYNVYENITNIIKEGKITDGIILSLLEDSKKNPENIMYQYLAYSIGSIYLYDGASHYEETVKAAIRFDQLFMKQVDKKENKNDILKEKINIGNSIYSCYNYEIAIKYYQEAVEYGGDYNVLLQIADCYNKLEEYDKFNDVLKEVLNENPESEYALYLSALNSLKINKLTESINYASRLTEILLKSEENISEIESYLYSYIQYLTISDSSYTNYSYKVYPEKLDEKQLNMVEKNKFLYNYIEAVYNNFYSRDYEKAINSIDKVIKEKDGLSQAYYLKGSIYYAQKEYKKAVEQYKQSINIDDTKSTVWYALAYTYDALADYENAYICCLKVKELLPYSDHGEDFYGVAAHNDMLMNSVTRELGK